MRLKRKGLLPRKEYVRDAKLCVIATEGTDTEKQYFEGRFGSAKLKIEVLDTGTTGLSAPQQVLERLTTFEQKYDLGDEDERWLMIDVDYHRAEFLSAVCQEAMQKNFQLAVSNPCFELWLWLHVADANLDHTKCKDLKQHLKDELGGYNWANLDLSHYTQERIEQAVQRARALHIMQDERWPPFPGTHVYKVVERLMPYLRPMPPQ